MLTPTELHWLTGRGLFSVRTHIKPILSLQSQQHLHYLFLVLIWLYSASKKTVYLDQCPSPCILLSHFHFMYFILFYFIFATWSTIHRTRSNSGVGWFRHTLWDHAEVILWLVMNMLTLIQELWLLEFGFEFEHISVLLSGCKRSDRFCFGLS